MAFILAISLVVRSFSAIPKRNSNRFIVLGEIPLVSVIAPTRVINKFGRQRAVEFQSVPWIIKFQKILFF